MYGIKVPQKYLIKFENEITVCDLWEQIGKHTKNRYRRCIISDAGWVSINTNNQLFAIYVCSLLASHGLQIA